MLDLRAVIQDDLDRLEASYKEMVAQQAQLAQVIEQQRGGIAYARMLLQKIDEEDRTASEVQGQPTAIESDAQLSSF